MLLSKKKLKMRLSEKILTTVREKDAIVREEDADVREKDAIYREKDALVREKEYFCQRRICY